MVQGLFDHILGSASFGVLLSGIQFFIQPPYPILLLLTNFKLVLVLQCLALLILPIFSPFDVLTDARGVASYYVYRGCVYAFGVSTSSTFAMSWGSSSNAAISSRDCFSHSFDLRGELSYLLVSSPKFLLDSAECVVAGHTST